MLGNDPSPFDGLNLRRSRQTRRLAKVGVIRDLKNGRRPAAPVAEVLERRTLLTAVPYQVTTLADDASGSTVGSLRYWLDAAEAASQAETITFAPGLTGTINLVARLDIFSGTVNVDGPGPGLLTINGLNAGTIFDVASGGTLGTLSGLTLLDGSGVNGAVGGGNGATLHLNDDVFNSSSVFLFNGTSYAAADVVDTLFLGTSFDTDSASVNVDASTFESSGLYVGIDGAAATLGVQNSTFTGLNASGVLTSGANPAIHTGTATVATIQASTFFDNSTGSSTLENDDSSTPAVLQDDIIYGNTSTTPKQALSGSFASQGYNDIQTTNTGGVADGSAAALVGGARSTDLLGVNPALSNPVDFGGRTPTLAPSVGSGVVGKGDPGLFGTDQRGVTRSSTAPTIGAFEGTGLVEVVTSTATTGAGSLGQAITNANAGGAGMSAITFNIAGGTTHSIVLSSILPTINVPVTIDATSQSIYTGSPVVQLYAGNAFVTNGLSLASTAGGSTIRGLSLGGFSNDAVSVNGTTAPVLIAGDTIGYDPTFTNHGGNSNGVFINGDASNVQVGGTTFQDSDSFFGAPGAVNVTAGVFMLSGSSGNQVEGNAFGVSLNGLAVGGSASLTYGVLDDGDSDTIGGIAAGAGNLFGAIASDNAAAPDTPVYLGGAGNLVAGNFFGVALDGQTRTAYNDRAVFDTGIDNQIGIPDFGNLIEDSNFDAIVAAPGSSGSNIQANTVVNNQGYGITIVDGPATIGGTGLEGNVIGYDALGGILINGATNVIVQGNRIGVDAIGNELPGDSGVDGITLENSATDETIGGNLGSEGNVISGFGVGLEIDYTAGGFNTVVGNFIGTDPTGEVAMANGIGVDLTNSTNNTFNGNLISGNTSEGLNILNSASNTITGNLIGTNATGLLALPNEIGVDERGTNSDTFSRNVVSGNTQIGIDLIGDTVDRFSDDLVGLAKDGVTPLGNSTGFDIESGGNISIGAGEAISANQTIDLNIVGSGAATVSGAFIGTSSLGVPLATPPSSLVGIDLNGAATTGTVIESTVVSGIVNGPGIAISGAVNTSIRNSTIGLGADGSTLDGSEYGIQIFQAVGATVSGSTISGNANVGIDIGISSTGVSITGNDIGTDKTGELARANGTGVQIDDGADGAVLSGNLISGNNDDGVYIGAGLGASNDDSLTGNLIGVDRAGVARLGNGGDGVEIDSGSSGNTIGAGNVISGNSGDGLNVSGFFSDNNSINGVTIGLASNGLTAVGNGLAGIDAGGPNTTITDSTISGNAAGIYLEGGATSSLVEGDSIGLSANGLVAVGNSAVGLAVYGPIGVTISGNTFDATKASSGASAAGIELDGPFLDGAAPVIQGNILGSAPGFGNAGPGLYINDAGAQVTLGGSVAGESNFYGYNGDAGLLIDQLDAEGGPAFGGGTFQGTSTLGERFAGNHGSAILIGNLATSPTSPPTFGPTSPLFAPVITSAAITSGLLDVQGYALPGTIIGFYASAATDTPSNSEGVEYLGAEVEGSSEDTNPANGSGALAGLAYFGFVFAVPSTIHEGMNITAVSSGTVNASATSEFAADADAGDGTIGPVIGGGGVVTLAVGQTFTYQGSLGDNVSATISGMVNYQDGTDVPLAITTTELTEPGYDDYAPLLTGTYQLSHVFNKPGTYEVALSVLDGDGYTADGEVTVVVVAASPTIDPGQVTLYPTGGSTANGAPATVSVGGSVTIHGSYDDPNTASGATDAVTIYWGDGSTPSAATVYPSTHTFTASHTYTTPSSSYVDTADPADSGLYIVTAILTDSEAPATLTATVAGGNLVALVKDVAPTNLKLGFTAATVAPGAPVSLSGSFVGPNGASYGENVTVNWGDGSAETVVSLAPGQDTFSGLTHAYQTQPAYRAGTPYRLTVSVGDVYEPDETVTASANVSVAAPAASALTIALARTEIAEGGSASLSGTLAATVPGDPHVVLIAWGDGTVTEVPLASGVASFSGVTHAYAINSAGQKNGVYAINATALDTTQTLLAPASATTSIKVDDVAPTVSRLIVTTPAGVAALNPLFSSTPPASLTSVVEGSTVFLAGDFTNPGGALDGDTVLINWGDGTSDLAVVQPSTTPGTPSTFLDKHTYADLAAGTTSLTRTIVATATDREGSSGSASTTLTITHPTPLVSIQSGGFAAGPQTLDAVITGGDTATLNYAWSLDGTPVSESADYTLPAALKPTSGNSTSHIVSITVTEASNPSETSTYTAQLDLLNTPGQTFVVPAPSTNVTPAINGILVTDFGGDSILEGEPVATSGGSLTLVNGMPVAESTSGLSVAPATMPLIFDTNATGDTYVGNSGNDAFNEHTDGTVAYGMGGNNTFNIQALCTIEAVAGSGSNTISLASNPYAAKLNLQDTSGQPQDVQAGSTDHVVELDDPGTPGAFSTLDCSNFGDTITPASGSTIVGGGGTDTIMLDSAENVTVMASLGGDVLENQSGSSLSGLNYVDANGSTGAASFVNDKNATLSGALSFVGDSGETSFTNSGTVAVGGTIQFDGDGAQTTFTNAGIQSGTIQFDGDSGGPASPVTGSGGTIQFDGDNAAALFVNNTGATQSGEVEFFGDSGAPASPVGGNTGTIQFDGDGASATFENAGIQTGTIAFDGDGGESTFNNSGGTATGPIQFDGDGGESTFNNGSGSTQTGTIAFDGDGGESTFTNTGTTGGMIQFDGDGGESTFANTGGTAGGTIQFDGDGGESTFTNTGTTAGGTIQFDGDGGESTFNNNTGGTAGGTIQFDGDGGESTFNNNPGSTQSGTIQFDGDSGVPTSPGSGSSGTIQFDGDGSEATFNNYAGAIQTGTVLFDGDSGSPASPVTGGDNTPIQFDGDGSEATFNNNPGATAGGTIQFDGDGTESTFSNGTNATTNGSIAFDGDGGEATFTNTGTTGGTIAFDGDGTESTFTNSPGGTTSGTIAFDGDGGEATFTTSAGSTQSGTIQFDGDGTESTFTNNSGTVTTGTIQFDGDGGEATFNNGTGATQSTPVQFDGDGGESTFNNSGTVSSGTTIVFDGDGGEATFNNAPGGTQTGPVQFDGDNGQDLYINGSTADPSPTAQTLDFAGSGNADILWNQVTVPDLDFIPAPDAASATLVNTGTLTSYSITTANSTVPSIALDNGAIINGIQEGGTIDGPITFVGGSESGSLVNDGTITGSVTFVGQVNEPGGTSTLINLAGGSIDGGIKFEGDAGVDALTNDGSIQGALVACAGTGPITVINEGTGATKIDDYGDSKATGTSATITRDNAANRLLNLQAGVASIDFVGGGGGNYLDNEADGVGTITLVASGAGNFLDNTGNSFGQIVLNGDQADSTLTNFGNGGTASTITLNEDGGVDIVENFGTGLSSITMSGEDDASGLENEGAIVGSISFQGGDNEGVLYNLGTTVGSISANDPSEFITSGVVGSVSIFGGDGTVDFGNSGTIEQLSLTGGYGDEVINTGTIAVASAGGQGDDDVSSTIQNDQAPLKLVNEVSGTISGLTIATTGALTVCNYGTLSADTIEANGPSARFIGYASSVLDGVTYDASTGGDAVQVEGAIDGLVFQGSQGSAANELELFGSAAKTDIDYLGGLGGDTLYIDASATDVSGVTLTGDEGTDTINSYAPGITDVTLVDGAGDANFYNKGNGGSGLKLVGGAGTSVFYNGGPGTTGGNDTVTVTVIGGSGATALDSTGADFGTLKFVGGSGENYLENDGAGTSSSTICFTGGTGANTLDNTGNGVGSIFFTDGTTPSSTPGGPSTPDEASDTFSNTGNDIGSITAIVNSGELGLTSSGDGVGLIKVTAVGGSSSVSNLGSVTTLSLDGGLGNASLTDTPDSSAVAAGSTIVFSDEGGTSTFIDSAPASKTTFVAGPVGAQVVIQAGASGPISLNGGTGGDTYTFEGAPTASVTIDQPASTGSGSFSNELDFSTFTGGALNLNLDDAAPQNEDGLVLTLADGSGINEVVGSPAANTITGNGQADILDTESLAVPTPTAGASGSNTILPLPANGSPPQWVYLDFDTYADSVDSLAPQVYTTLERAEILAGIEADYADFAFVHITENKADLTNVPLDDQIILYFNRTPDGTGQPGGQSSEIDFGGFDPGRYAEIQVNGLIGGPGNPPAFTGTQDNFAVLSAKIGAHELSHLLGVRHSDAFGPIGYGVHTPPGDSEFSPDMNGPDAAFETFDHIVSSPATQGTTRLNDIRSLYFGPREAIKLAFSEEVGTATPANAGTVATPGAAPIATHTTMATALAFPFYNLSVPNDITTLAGVEQGMDFQVLANAVSDTIAINPANGLAAPNWYSFYGQKGDDFTFETESQILPGLANGGSVDTVLGVYNASGTLLGYYGGSAENNNQFEGTDSLLDDVIIPYTGKFYVEVSSYVAPAGDAMYDPANPASPLNVNNLTSVDNPASPFYNAADASAFLSTGQGTAVGSYDLFIYRYDQWNATSTTGSTLTATSPGATLAGALGNDTLIGEGSATLIQGADLARTANSPGSDTTTLSATMAGQAVDLYNANLGMFDVNDSNTMAGAILTINYGDGTAVTTIKEPNTVEPDTASIPLSHLYSKLGAETITITYQLASGGTDMLEIPVTITGLEAPEATPPAIQSGTLTTAAPITFSSTISNFYPGHAYQAVWTFTDLNHPGASPITVNESVTTASFSLSELLATASTYTVSVALSDTTNGTSSPAVAASSSFTVLAKVPTSVTLAFEGQANSVAYTGAAFVPSSLIAITVNGATNPVASTLLSYAYEQVFSTGTSSLIQGLPTDAGTYELIVTYAGDSTHLGSSNAQSPFTFSITAINPTITPNVTSTPYNGSAYAGASATASGLNGVALATPTLTYYNGSNTTELANNGAPPVDAGSYTVRATYAGSTDYNTLTVSTPFTISAINPTVTPHVASTSYNGVAYAGASATASGLNGVALATPTLTYYNASNTTELANNGAVPTDAGSYTVRATYAGSTDYNTLTVSTPFTISAINPTITPHVGSTSYTGAAYAGASATATGLNGIALAAPTLTYYNASNTTELASNGAPPVDAGSYTVRATYAGSTDYNALTVSTAFTISAINPTITPHVGSTSYTGAAYAGASATATGVNGVALATPILTYYNASNTTELANNGAPPVDAGSYYVRATYAGSTDYNTLTVSTPFTISAINPTITPHVGSTSYTGAAYAGASATATGLNGIALAAPTLTYYNASNTTELASNGAPPVDAGSYYVRATYAGSTDYNTLTVSTPFTISAINPTLTLSPSSPVYTGFAYTGATPTLTGVNGVALPGAVVTYTNAATGQSLGTTPPTDVGSYTASASSAATLDYNAATTSALSFKITPAPLKVTVNNATKAYGIDDTTQLGGTVAGLLDNDPLVITYASTGSTSLAAVGSYPITVTDSAPSNPTKVSDYTLSYTQASVTVTADSTTLALASSASSVVYGAPVTFTLTVKNIGSTQVPTGTVTITANGTAIGTANAGGTSSGQATWTFTTSSLTAGTSTIGASFAPTSNFQASSSTLSQTVTAAPTSTTLKASAQGFGQTTTLTATVVASSPSTATPSGVVTFTDATTGATLGTATLSGSGVATLVTAALAGGSNSITASFAATASFLGSTSSTVTVVEQASVYVLNTTASGALNLSGSATVNVPGTVEVDSSSSTAVQLSGNTKVTASAIGIVGGSQVTGSSSFGVTPSKVASFADPLASLAIPSASAYNLKTQAAVNLGGVSTLTIGPGIYPSITVGASASLTLTAGVYVIDGGGLTVSGAGILNGTAGVLIYNAGSNYNGGSGSSFGAVTFGSGTVNLAPMATGPYAGIAIFQSRDNTKAMSISGAVLANLGGGTVYAPSAVLNISGSGQVGTSGTPSSLIVNELVVSGAAGAFELADGSSDGYDASTSNWINDPILTVAAEDDNGDGLDPAEVADLGSAMDYLNQALAAFGVDLSWAPSGTTPDVVVHFSTTTPEGDASDGVLGFTTAQNAVYIVTGWDYYTGSDPSQIGSNQYDFTTLATHELAHTLGLGESQDPDSVMYEYLAPGTVRRSFNDDNLTTIDTDSDRFMKAASGFHLAVTAQPSPAAPSVSIPLALTTPPAPAIDSHLFDSALAALDPAADPTSTLATTEVDRLDEAIAVVAREPYVVPLVVAQDVADAIADLFNAAPTRKPSSHLA